LFFSWFNLDNFTESGDNMKTWEELRLEGSEHYRGVAQPIDIYKSKGVFKPFALCSIIKYATRNLDKDLNPNDIKKIIHYAELLLAEQQEQDEKYQTESRKDQSQEFTDIELNKKE
jgi:hypothetical protein